MAESEDQEMPVVAAGKIAASAVNAAIEGRPEYSNRATALASWIDERWSATIDPLELEEAFPEIDSGTLTRVFYRLSNDLNFRLVYKIVAGGVTLPKAYTRPPSRNEAGISGPYNVIPLLEHQVQSGL